MDCDGLLAFASKINSGRNLSVGLSFSVTAGLEDVSHLAGLAGGLLQVLELHSLS